MSNLVTDWQTALIALLTQDTPDGLGIAKILPRERDGLSQEEDIGCVFAPKPSWQPATDVLFANFFMTVRVWRRFATGQAEPIQAGGPLTAQIDQLGIDLAKLLEPVQVGLIPNFYFWITQLTADYADQGIEARLTGWANNPATLPS